MEVTVLQRQSLSDIAVQVYGSLAGVIAIARANNISVSTDLKAGTVLKCPDVIYDNYMQTYVRKNGIRPATAYDGRGELPSRIFTHQFTYEFD